MNDPIIGKKKNPSALKQFNEKALFVCFIGRFTITRENKIVDNKDGTISLVNADSQGSEYCPYPPLAKNDLVVGNKSRAYMKKCLQGQVYRQAQNDCKGTGTAANYYGAQKLQFCPTNVSTCGDLSPAKISCLNDTTGGVTRDGSFSNFVSYYSEIKSYFKGRTDEIPSAKTDYYWDSTSKIAFNVDGQLASPTPNYDSFQYVLCY